MTQQLQIPYLAVNNTKALIGEALKLETEDGLTMRDIKIKALRTLDIEVEDTVGEYDLSDVWGRHVHEINGLEFSKPYHPDIVNAIRSNLKVYKFFFFLT